MAASLLHFLSPPPPQLQRNVPNVVFQSPVSSLWHHRWNPKLSARPGLPCFPTKRSLELRCASNGALVVGNSERYNMFDKSDRNADDMDDLERQLQEFFVDVKTMLEMGNKDDAIYLLQANYEAVKEQIDGGSQGIEQAAILDILALGYMGVGDFKLVEHLLDMLDDIVGGLHDGKPPVDSILMHMGSMYATLGKYDDALDVYERGLNILEREFGNGSPFLITPLMGMAKVLKLLGRATKSIAFYHRAVDILEKNRGAGSVELVVPLYGLGNLFISEGKAADAETCFKREQEGRALLEECLLITERYKGIEHPSSVVHLLNLATSYSRSKDFVEAERLLRTCLHIMLKTVGPKDQSVTVPMLHLAVTLYHLKQDEEAERLALEVVHIREDAFGKESLPVGEALDCLVSIQMRLGKDHGYVLAKLDRILNIQEKEMGYESEEVMETLKKLVFYLDKLGKRDEKLPLQRRLSSLRAKYKQKAPV